MKVTLTGVWHNATNKDGKPFISKKGQPYEWCSIKTQEHGDRYLNGFGNKTTKGWQVGDSVEIIVKESGNFLNFSLPKEEKGGLSDLDREMLLRIEKKVDSINWHIVEFLRAQRGGQPMYPSPEVEGIDIDKTGQVPELSDEEIPF